MYTKFKRGDLVYIVKGEVMVIAKVLTYGNRKVRYWCDWFEDEEARDAIFTEDLLRRAK